MTRQESGRLGGLSGSLDDKAKAGRTKSEAKRLASIANGKKGGRPRKSYESKYKIEFKGPKDYADHLKEPSPIGNISA